MSSGLYCGKYVTILVDNLRSNGSIARGKKEDKEKTMRTIEGGYMREHAIRVKRRWGGRGKNADRELVTVPQLFLNL